MFKRVIILFIGSLSLLPLNAQNFQVVTGKSVIIDGVTSLGRFACDYQSNNEFDTLLFDSNKIRTEPVMDILLPVNQFGCGNKMLERDFSRTLRSENYPFIHVLVQQFFKEGDAYFSSLKLKLVGKELYMEKLPFILIEEGNHRFLKAEFEINLKYFELDPPKKFLGLLKVHEELKIRLFITLKPS